MAKTCDNTTVGMVVRNGDLIAVIERANYPEAYALPAGHVDGDEPWTNGLRRECQEEIGLDIKEELLVWKGVIDNPCKREGGDHHLWELYEAIAWEGELRAGSDAKKARWMTLAELKSLAVRTEYFMQKYSMSYERAGDLTKAIFGPDPEAKSTDPEWKKEKGLEPVWYYLLTEIQVL